MPSTQTATESRASPLSHPTTAVSGVGPALQRKLAARGIEAVSDLLFLVPRTYEDRRSVVPIGQLSPGDRAAVVGSVVASGASGWGRSRRYEIAIEDDTGMLRLVYFNFNPHRMRLDYRRGERLWAFGTVSSYRGVRQMAHPEISRQGGADRESGIVGVYPEVGGIHRRTIRRIVRSAVDSFADALVDSVPPQVLRRTGLPDLHTAVRALHQPPEEEIEALQEGRSAFQRRLAFDEFFHLQVALAQRRAEMSRERAIPVTTSSSPGALARELLPFELTGGQERALAEIAADLEKPWPMARLLQGDVGSGKTAVAVVAALAVCRAGLQSAIQVPTEILAEQHARVLRELLGPTKVAVALLTGSTRAAERRQIIEQLQQGTVHVAVGTHALFQPDVLFARLGLVVIDEQHRFGVRQRAALAERGAPLEGSARRSRPHQLVMTATPIPRSLSLTLYGDLALSVIDELPPGRQPVTTSVVPRRRGKAIQRAVRKVLDEGGQVFMVFPLVEESEKLDLEDATAGAAEMRELFPDCQVGLLTGRHAGQEKDAVMRGFADGQTQILVATTVVEVGIDVPQATLMVIFNAERFGLSQLHQLRGRVGRGDRPSSCLLVHGGGGGEEALRRLRIMEATTDGFRIAEEDLAIRGPGDLMGTRQAGVPTFTFADLMRHGHLLEQARQAAIEVVEQDPHLELPEHLELGRALHGRYRDRIGLAQGG